MGGVGGVLGTVIRKIGVAKFVALFLILVLEWCNSGTLLEGH